MEVRGLTKVSVIVPVYNVAAFLPRCLDSLLAQTLREIEIVCVDDGSTDGSGALLDGYAAKDGRVRVIHQSNAGAGPARNAGLDAATGDYLFFCDPDDNARPQMLERLYARAEATDADVVLSGRIARSRYFGMLMPVYASAVFLRGPEVFCGRDCSGELFTAARTALWDKLFRRAFVAGQSLRFQAVAHSNDLYFVTLAVALAERMSVEDGAYYIHCSWRPGSLQNTKDGLPTSFLEAYDACEDALTARERMADYRSALALLLLRCGGREIVKFKSAEAVSCFYGGFRSRFVQIVSKMTEGELSLWSRTDRCLANVVRSHEDSAAFCRLCRVRRWRGQWKRLLCFLFGGRIRDVW